MSDALWPAELLQEPCWAMEPKAFQALARRISEGLKLGRSTGPLAALPRQRSLEVRDGTARIAVRGALLKTVPRYFEWLGLAATAYPDIEADLQEALADPGVSRILLEIESPGGSSTGIKRVADAIFAARGRKPVIARVEDLAGSAAYWLGSQAGEISAAPMAVVGSIGAYIAYMDLSSMASDLGVKVEVFTSGPLKGAGMPGTSLSQEQRADLQKFVDDVTSEFRAAVSRGRRVSAEKVREWATGATWLAEDAHRMGLVDRVESESELVARVAPAGSRKVSMEQPAGTGASLAAGVVADAPFNPVKETKPMEDAEKRALEAIAAERQRVAGIQEWLGPRDPALCGEAVAKGWTIDQAKAAYAEKADARLEAEKKARAEAEERLARAKAAPGADPIPAGGKPGEAKAPESFLEAAKAVQHARGYHPDGRPVMSIREAMSHVARTRPELYDQHLQATGAGQVLELRRKHDAEERARR